MSQKIMSFAEWLPELAAQAQQMGVALEDLPMPPQKIYMLERAGFVVDMETGAIVAMGSDRVYLSPAGEALAVVIRTGFLDEGGGASQP